MTNRLVLHDDAVGLVRAAAGRLIAIARDTDLIPATISEFAAEIRSGALVFDLPASAANAAQHNAERLVSLAAAFRTSVAELLHAANLPDDLDGLKPARRGEPG